MSTQNSADRIRSILPWLAAILIGAVVIALANHRGWWWLTVLIGVLVGLGLRGARMTISVALLAALLGWGGDLALQARSVDIVGAAGVVAAILGLSRGAGAVVIGVALLFAALLALGGVWLGAAFRRAVVAFVRPA